MKHDLFGKPASTFPDHALGLGRAGAAVSVRRNRDGSQVPDRSSPNHFGLSVNRKPLAAVRGSARRSELSAGVARRRGLPDAIHGSRPAGRIFGDACHGRENRRHLAATLGRGRRQLHAVLVALAGIRPPGLRGK